MLAHNQGALLNAFRLAGRPVAGAAFTAVSGQHRQTPGKVAQGLCARQRAGAHPARHSGRDEISGPSRGRAELGRLRYRKPVGRGPERTQASFYRTGAGAEIDLVLDIPGQRAHGLSRSNAAWQPGRRGGFTAPDKISNRRAALSSTPATTVTRSAKTSRPLACMDWRRSSVRYKVINIFINRYLCRYIKYYFNFRMGSFLSCQKTPSHEGREKNAGECDGMDFIPAK